MVGARLHVSPHLGTHFSITILAICNPAFSYYIVRHTLSPRTPLFTHHRLQLMFDSHPHHRNAKCSRIISTSCSSIAGPSSALLNETPQTADRRRRLCLAATILPLRAHTHTQSFVVASLSCRVLYAGGVLIQSACFVCYLMLSNHIVGERFAHIHKLV